MAELPNPNDLPGRKLRNFASQLIGFIKADRAVAGTGLTEANISGQRALNRTSGGGGGGGAGGTNTYYVVIDGVLNTDDFTSAGPTPV